MGEEPRDGEIIDVVSRHWRKGAISAEASKAGDYEVGICGQQIIRVEPNRLKYSWAKRVDEDVGMFEEGFEKGKAIGGFEV